MSDVLHWFAVNLEYFADGVFISSVLSFFVVILHIRTKARVIRTMTTELVPLADRPVLAISASEPKIPAAVMLGESGRFPSGSEGLLSRLWTPATPFVMMGTSRGPQANAAVMVESGLAATDEDVSWPFLPPGQSGRILNVPGSRQKNMACSSAR